MKLNSLLLLSLIGSVAVNAITTKSNLFGGYSPMRTVDRNDFGNLELVDYSENGGLHKTVQVSNKMFRYDWERQTKLLYKSLNLAKVNKEKIANNRIYTCDNRGDDPEFNPDDPGYFFPLGVGSVSPSNPSIQFSNGLCFKNITFSYAQTAALGSNETGDVTITIDTENPDSLLCKDWFFFATTELHHVETFYLTGKHQITFKNISANAQADILRNGFRVYMFCEGYIDTFISIFNFALMFIGADGTDPNLPIFGSHIPEYMEHANLVFLKDLMGYDLQKRNITNYEYDPANIQSGDYLGVLRLDGLSPIINYGSGSHASHATMALRFDGELYIVESRDGNYWPRHGIQRNTWEQWVEWAENADFNVVHLPLNAEARKKFNETAAQEFFNMTDGLPYGFHNFIFGWIDTPSDNLPPIMPSGFLPIVFSIFEDIEPKIADIFAGQAFNKRLGTQNLTFDELAAEAARQNKSLDDVMAMVEVEGWEYHGLEPRDGRAYVCSAYVAAQYQAAGLLHNVNGPEFAPRDVYSLNFFDLNWTRPAGCAEADPDQAWCQVMGKYRITLPLYSTIEPYEHMAERCPSVAPEYERPAGC